MHKAPKDYTATVRLTLLLPMTIYGVMSPEDAEAVVVERLTEGDYDLGTADLIDSSIDDIKAEDED